MAAGGWLLLQAGVRPRRDRLKSNKFRCCPEFFIQKSTVAYNNSSVLSLMQVNELTAWMGSFCSMFFSERSYYG
jgi:hypothetical protein